MFQRAFRLLILVSLALVVSPAIAPLQAQPEAVPYIYYFSNTLKAFVIERADGTDTRILGDGLLAPDASEYANAYSEGYYLIDGPGWSPSGRWLAWGADLFTGYYDHGSGSKPYVIRSDGAQRVTMLDNLDDAEMAWAPHADLLLVASQLDPFSGANKNTFIGLIDPTRNVPIAAFSLPFSHAMNCGIGDVRWTADGHGIAQYTVTDVPAIYDFEARQGFFIVDTKGAAVQKVFDRIITDEPFGEGCTAALSAVGDIAYQVQHALVVENLITGVRHIIPDVFSTDKEFEGAHLHWNSDGRYGLLFGGRGAASGNPADLKLLMRDTNRVVSLLPNGLMEESDPGQSWPLWSPDGNHALLLNGDKLYHVDADSGTISPLLEDVSSSTIGFMWTGSSQVMVARGVVNEGQAQKSAMDAYDFTTGKHTTLSDIPEEHVAAYGGPHYHFDLSPDGNFMAYVEHGLVIHDLRTGADRRIRPSPRGTQYDGGGEASWSKDGRWLFIYESSGMTTPYPRDVSIVRADGEMRRTLTYTDFTPTPVLLDWLPEQVKLETLPPALKRPSYPSPQ
ncbi:MAG TPA: hypothetical protein VKQ72_08065, partial [Aggregatilineales bacterium]|nr:hypothetical protein [Aggregatilineales bacterium]